MTKIDDIKFYRGPEDGVPAAEEGEPLFTTDTHRLFVGSNSGNVEFARKDDLGTGVSESYTASDGQTVFNTTHAFTAGAGQTKVSIDGVPQPLGTSYTEVGTNEIVLSEGVPAGAVVTIALFELTSDLGSQVSSNTAQISANTSSLADIATVNNHTVTYTYNPDGSVQSTTEKDSSNNTIKTVTYTYNVAGDVAQSITVMNGKTVTTTYNYDANANITSTSNVIS